MGRARVKKGRDSLRGKSSGLIRGLYSENYHLVYHHAEKLRFIGILAYPKMLIDLKKEKNINV
jgi:hypothetical protein